MRDLALPSTVDEGMRNSSDLLNLDDGQRDFPPHGLSDGDEFDRGPDDRTSLPGRASASKP